MRTRKLVNRLISFCICLIAYSLVIQCHSQELGLEDKKIISLLVDKLASPLPPPPPVESKDTIIPQNIVDSLLKVKMTIAIYPSMENTIEQSELKGISKEFKQLIDTTQPTRYIEKIDGIKSKKGHSIILCDTLNLKKSYDFDSFDMLYWFSRIWYNDEKTKALVSLGVSRSRLDGYGTIFCLEKKKENWHVMESIPTTIW